MICYIKESGPETPPKNYDPPKNYEAGVIVFDIKKREGTCGDQGCIRAKGRTKGGEEEY